MSVVKVGLMGCGRIAQLVHLPVLTHLPDVELVALAETDPERLEKARHLVPKAVVFDHYEKLLKMENVWETLEMVKMVCYSGFTTSIMAMGL